MSMWQALSHHEWGDALRIRGAIVLLWAVSHCACQLTGCAVFVQVPMDQPKVMLKLLSQFVNGRDMSSLTTGRAASSHPPRGRITWHRPRGSA